MFALAGVQKGVVVEGALPRVAKGDPSWETWIRGPKHGESPF